MFQKFRLNLYIPLIITSLLMSIFTVFIIIYIQEDSIHKSKQIVSKQFEKYLHEKVKDEAAILEGYIYFIQNMDDVAKKFQSSNKKELYETTKNIFEYLNQKTNLTHMYFIGTDEKVLLRVHKYNKDSDTIDRTTFQKARESQSLYYGLEFGLMKNYTLRVVKPWYVDGKLIGYLELGKEIDTIIDELAEHLKTNIYMAVKKEVYTNSPKFVKEDIEHKVATKNHYIAYNTFAVPPQMESILDNKIDFNDITFQKNDYFVSKSILSDVSGKELGYFIFLSDVSLEHNIMKHSAKFLAIVLLIITFVLIFAAYLLIRNREEKINLLNFELNEQKEELALNNNKLQKLFNLQKNIIIITDKKKLIMANQALYDFFGFDSLETFLKYHNCICDRFVDNDDFFNLSKVPEGKDWVNIIKKLSGDKRIVAMLDNHMESHAFSVSVSEYEEEKYIVSFTDISYTLIEHKKLQLKVTHDKLTDALNREFFENNIELIIKESKPQQLGLIICDIDHFKTINDTYGHNRGDIVLRHLVDIIKESIRQEDYLIRWGGEEFIILMQVNSIDALKKSIEKLRIQIENEYFQVIEHITVSFGGTIYQDKEEVIQCIERADKALYLAKENGRNQVQLR